MTVKVQKYHHILGVVILLINSVENKIFPSHVSNVVKDPTSTFQESQSFHNWGLQPCSAQCLHNDKCEAYAIANDLEGSDRKQGNVKCILLEKVVKGKTRKDVCPNCQIFEVGPLAAPRKESFLNSECEASAMFTAKDHNGNNIAYVFCKNNYVYKIKEGSWDDVIEKEHVTDFLEDFSVSTVNIATGIGQGTILISSDNKWMFYESPVNGKKPSMVKANGSRIVTPRMKPWLIRFATRMNLNYVLFMGYDNRPYCLNESSFFSNRDNNAGSKNEYNLFGNKTHFGNGTLRSGKPSKRNRLDVSSNGSDESKENNVYNMDNDNSNDDFRNRRSTERIGSLTQHPGSDSRIVEPNSESDCIKKSETLKKVNSRAVELFSETFYRVDGSVFVQIN